MHQIWSYGARPYDELQSSTEVIEYVKSGKRLSQPDGCPADLYAIMTDAWADKSTDRPSFAELEPRVKAVELNKAGGYFGDNERLHG